MLEDDEVCLTNAIASTASAESVFSSDSCVDVMVATCDDESACNTGAEGDCAYAEDNYDCDGNCVVDVDCAGDCGGSAVEDECGVCNGDGIADGACDCDGNVDLGCGCNEPGPSGCDNACGSTLVDDECGECGGDNSSCEDCAGVPNGNSELDDCDVCWSPYCYHYNVDTGEGDHFVDYGSNEVDCVDSGWTWVGPGHDMDPTWNADQDCAGDCFGDAVEDECGECNGDGPEDNYDCDGNCLVDVDCAGDCGGLVH
jgi:hypothetical protein